MGKAWDGGDVAFDPETWFALAEHLLPGAFGMAFASSRGWHRLAVAIEDAGLRIHPSIFGWAYGSGFPKASNLHMQFERTLCELVEINDVKEWRYTDTGEKIRTKPPFRHKDANTWYSHRYGLQAMKPALEPIIVFQKPYKGKPVDSIVETGAGALSIDGARIGMNEVVAEQYAAYKGTQGIYGEYGTYLRHNGNGTSHPQGRWPANFYLDEEAAKRLGEQSGDLKSGANPERRSSDKFRAIYQPYEGQRECVAHRGADEGTAARFFFNVNRQLDEADPVLYCGKASRKERDAGLEKFDEIAAQRTQDGGDDTRGRPIPRNRNFHPTIKPIDLTRWLATLLLPPPEYAPRRILVPFAGSGSEMIGAHLAGWEEIIGIEREREYVEIAKARLAYWSHRPKRFALGF